MSTTLEMQDAVLPRAEQADVVIMAAAVSDFRPASPADHKLKKSDGLDAIALERTHDFLVDLGANKPAGQTLVGFAAETDDLEANARDKLERKQLDLIVANDVSAPGVGFAHDTNEVLILSREGASRPVPLADKRIIADAIFDAIIETR